MLPSGTVLVALKYDGFRFYSADLVHVKNIELTDVHSDSYETYHFKHLKHSQSGSFIMLARVRNLAELKAKL